MNALSKEKLQRNKDIRKDYKEMLTPGIKKGYVKNLLAAKYALTETTLFYILNPEKKKKK